MNVYRFELRAQRSSLLTWCASIWGLTAMLLLIYPAFAGDVDAFHKLLQGFPPEVLQMLAMDIDMVSSVSGYYAFAFVYISLVGAIQALLLGLRAVAREGMAKTMDFLLTKPMTRASLLTAKLCAALTSIVATNIAFFAFALLMTRAVARPGEAFDAAQFTAMTLCLLWVQLFFLAAGAGIATLLPRMRTVIPIAMGVALAFFLIRSIGTLDVEDHLRFLTPFTYFDASRIVRKGGLEGLLVGIGAAATAAMVFASYAIYGRRDIRAT